MRRIEVYGSCLGAILVWLLIRSLVSTSKSRSEPSQTIDSPEVEIVTLYGDSTAHEFILYETTKNTAITHWPDCKYCRFHLNTEDKKGMRLLQVKSDISHGRVN